MDDGGIVQVRRLIARGRHEEHAPLGREVDGPLGGADQLRNARSADRNQRAEAHVGDVHPANRADVHDAGDQIAEGAAAGEVRDLDRAELGIRGHRGHGDPVAAHDRRHVGAVGKEVPVSPLRGHERRADGAIELALEVEVSGVHAGIENAHRHALAGLAHLPGIVGVDATQIPLELREEPGAALIGLGAEAGAPALEPTALARRDELHRPVLHHGLDAGLLGDVRGLRGAELPHLEHADAGMDPLELAAHPHQVGAHPVGAGAAGSLLHHDDVPVAGERSALRRGPVIDRGGRVGIRTSERESTQERCRRQRSGTAYHPRPHRASGVRDCR